MITLLVTGAASLVIGFWAGHAREERKLMEEYEDARWVGYVQGRRDANELRRRS